MDATRIEWLLAALGCDRIKYGGRWVSATCPFAPWRHSKGRDKRPSFGILSSVGRSHYNCHACGASGNMQQLVWTIERLRGCVLPRARQLVTRDTPSIDEIEQMESRQHVPEAAKDRLDRAVYWGEAPIVSRRIDINALEYPVLPETDLDPFRSMPPAATSYLFGSKRRLLPHTLDVWELGWEPQRRRIVIPVRDLEGRLVGITGRAVDPDNQPKFLHSKGFKRDYFLFGEHLVERGQPGYLVEGHFDAIYLRQMGYPNAVAVMGSHLSVEQVEKLVALLSDVTIVPDGDEPGGVAAAKWERALTGRVPVRTVTVRDGADPDQYDQDELDELLALTG